MEGTIGEIRLFAGTYAPENWLMCQGQVLQIQQNTALFAVLSNKYGGDGQKTFALPDLRGRIPVGLNPAATPQLPQVLLGQQQGTATTTLTAANTPAHTHLVHCNNTVGAGTQNIPVGNFPAAGPAVSGTPVNTRYADAPGTNSAMNAQSVTIAGAGVPFSNTMPITALNYIICVVGYFPARN